MISRNRSQFPPSKRISLRASGLVFGLVAVLLVISCAPGASTESAPLPEVMPVTEAPNNESSTATEIPAVVTEAPGVVTDPGAVQPMVTPRGDALEATDPSTVSLASGQLHLVEFFRFT